jgi:hypothetical protein
MDALRRRKNMGAIKRDKTGRFVPGSTGGGRPPLPDEFRSAARKAALPALLYCIALVNNTRASDRDRLRASEIVLDRAFGKPPQALTGDGSLALAIVGIEIVGSKAD